MTTLPPGRHASGMRGCVSVRGDIQSGDGKRSSPWIAFLYMTVRSAGQSGDNGESCDTYVVMGGLTAPPRTWFDLVLPPQLLEHRADLWADTRTRTSHDRIH